MLLFCESFDYSNSSTHVNQKWDGGSGGAAEVTKKRTGVRSWYNFTYLQKNVNNLATVIAGVGVQLSLSGYNDSLITFRDGTTQQISVWANADNTLSVKRGATVLATSTAVLSTSAFKYIEFKITIHNTTGSYELRLDEAVILSGTNVDTQETANAYITNVRLCDGSNFGHYFDDFYLCDTAGAVNNDFLGAIKVECLFPSAVGNSSQWARGGTDSGANWSQVEETPPNDDTDYVSSSTTAEKDTYAYGNLATTAGSVKGVQIVPRVRKSDASVGSYAPIARSGAVEEEGTTVNPTETYDYYPDVFELDPSGAAWTIASVNAAEFGVVNKS